MMIGLVLICGIVGIIFYLKMIKFLFSSKVNAAYPPVRVLREKAKAMGVIGTIFIVFSFILYLFI
ncbi:hypothetical protein [Bacillus suaedaesalsae]|uniref:Uncharacterized protein n=1 Tax=Bacillus suaedaesalsae TaxID=2810349 RepID=A0ABS2DFG2_9BACI|nr:hypothetical protein [Bacillus suaedaesalsae]MBM6617207.1 hypothetical protein [Bacillus suaedaesalsae]